MPLLGNWWGLTWCPYKAVSGRLLGALIRQWVGAN